MKVLIACEYSGVVREAFRAKGHDAYSCDILPAEDASPFHYQADVKDILDKDWDLMIAHPPCTYLCNSGVWNLHWVENPFYLYNEDGYLSGGVYVNVHSKWIKDWNEERYEEVLKAKEFFMMLWNAPIPRICIENPVPHKYAELPKYTQTIQPYMFGDDASKRTCLWLKGLAPLSIPSEELWAPPRIVDGKRRWSNQTDSGQNKLGPSANRGLERARTYPGIANAFAEQWG